MTTPNVDRTGVAPGAIMAGELAEQPEVLARVIDRGLPAIREVAAAIGARRPGSSR